jgi:hypothetical protein
MLNVLANAMAQMALVGMTSHLWYSLPLIVATSLVYAGTRHESMRHILSGALRLGLMITGFLLAIFAVLYWISANL